MNLFYKLTIGFILIISSVTSGEILGQHPYYYRVSSELFPVNEVYELFQDSKKHIWIASKNGLFEYDGKAYRSIKGDDLQISSLSMIQEDMSGRIWVRNFRGEIFYVENSRMYYFADWGDSIQDFPCIYAGPDNSLWITSNNGFYRYNQDSGNWSLTVMDGKASEYPLNYGSAFLYPGPDTGIIVVNSRSFPLGQIKNNRFFQFSNYSRILKKHKGLNFQRAFQNHGNYYLISTNNQVFKVTGDSISFIRDLKETALKTNRVYWMTALKSGLFAAGTWDGLFFFDEQFNCLSKKPALEGNKISYILQDHEGSIWLSTLNNGIFVIPEIDVSFLYSGNAGFPDDGIYSLENGDESSIYIGFSKGQIGKLDSLGNFSLLFNPDTENEITGISHSDVFGQLFFIHDSFLTSLVNGRIVRIKGYQFSAPKEIRSIGSVLLVSSANGLSVINDQRTSSDLYPKDDLIFENLNTISLPGVPGRCPLYILRPTKKARTAVYDTITGRIWGGFNDGIFYFRHGSIKEFTIADQKVYANKIVMAPEGILWTATSSHGLLGIKDTLVIHRLQTEYPVYTLYFEDPFIWFTTMEGLYRYKYSTGELMRYDRYDGISSSEISSILVHENQVYAGTPEGILSFPVLGDFKNTIPPEIEITRFSIGEKDTSILDSYVLSYGQNNISIQFNGISFKSKGDYTFAYRMTGLNEDWIRVPSGNNDARYPSLPPGKYQFQVKTINEDGIESLKYKSISIEILKPFWAKWWFHLLVTLTLISIISIFFLIRIRIIRKRNILEKQLKASEIVAIKAQMNPHFIFNALNSIQDLVLQKEIWNSSTYLGMFSDLLRMVLEVSGEDFVKLKTETAILETYLNLEKLRFSDGFTFRIESGKVYTDHESLYIPSMIIQPYVENAIKHGLLHKHGLKNINIEFLETDQTLQCFVTDNGVGRQKAQEIKERRSKSYKAFATEANRRRVDLFNEIYDEKIKLDVYDLFEDNTPSGTRVVLTFPRRLL